MVNSFSNTKIRVPKGLQSLLVGLTIEILRSQPKDIHAFAAEYFEKLLQQREQGQSYLPDKQTTFEDRYYNNQSFREEYPVNGPDVNNAATKIQAQFRGHKTRRDLQKMKEKSSFDQQQFEEERREHERAAIAIQSQFRGFRVRKNLQGTSGSANQQQQQQQVFDNNYDKTPISSSNRHDLGETLTGYDEIEAGENDDIDRSHPQRESTQLSEDFERHTQIPRDSDFDREQQTENFNNEDDMSDPTLDKAATRIQASYRGYKTRKELGTGPVHSQSSTEDDQHNQPSSSSPQLHDEYNNTRTKNILSPSAEGNKVPVGEDDDNAAAVKIQAAYRGYRVRKDLEK